ncbi:hypothetical protein [Paenibacillus sp.]|uniref:hypothetical protein n=1 Tax=Paenibacillus sp. TaxID=58172 RepID=UPI0028115579|nr:hypothetical protein [Paenibacillus sp.]
MKPVKRNEWLKHLPNELSNERLAEMKKHAVCALTGSATDVTLDHFIPLEWGHGGQYAGNVLFLTARLNASKSNMNPFQWINRAKLREPNLLRGWDELIRRLAAENGLGTKEFRRYVHWCEKHKRTKEQVRLDPRPSLELWREARIREDERISVDTAR